MLEYCSFTLEAARSCLPLHKGKLFSSSEQNIITNCARYLAFRLRALIAKGLNDYCISFSSIISLMQELDERLKNKEEQQLM